jgi:hypothetical protein
MHNATKTDTATSGATTAASLEVKATPNATSSLHLKEYQTAYDYRLSKLCLYGAMNFYCLAN